ncbi:MAG: CBS domain-containing protein [candidate division NC10 bacterium]|nr:CBS domain-containing protein [candidate division NC10 bacterium]
MFFASRLQHTKVFDLSGRQVGTLQDLVVSIQREYPPVTSLIVKIPHRREPKKIPWRHVLSFEESEIFLSSRLEQIEDYPEKEQELWLIKEVLDKQIVDREGRKLIRVQDIQLARVNGNIRVMAVDISTHAILRRLGLGFLSERLGARSHFIDWSNVNLVASKVPKVSLKVSLEKLGILHPADIADIMNDLSPDQRAAVLQSLDHGVAADTIEEMAPSDQATALAEMESEKASDILEEMAPDNAADLLADLPQEKAQELLSLMEKEEAHEIRQLLAYPETSAGGIMTTEYMTVPATATAKEAIELIRKEEPEAETIYYLYVVDEEGHLLGVFSLRDLIVAPPEAKVTSFMISNVIKVDVMTRQEEVARLIAKYNLLAIPVVDQGNHLRGIVTVDDAIDVVIPTAWKKRFPRIYS